MGPLIQYSPQAIALAKSMLTAPMTRAAYSRATAILASQATKMNRAGQSWDAIKQIIKENRKGLKF